MKILIIGGSGVIGWNLLEFFKEKNLEVKFTFKTNQTINGDGYFLDITNKKETIETITKINPEIIIHSAALTNVDLCESDKELANQINVIGTDNIVKACQKIKSKIVYISTSFVFSKSEKKYTEKDIPSEPKTNYGLTKLKGEKIVLESGLESLILRIDQPYFWKKSWQHTNSVLRVIDRLSKKQELREIIDWYNVPTYIPNFLNATYVLIKNNHTGIFHLTGSNFINRFEWSILTAKIFQLDQDLIKPINSSSLNLTVNRDNVNLNNDKLFNETGIRMMGVKEGLTEMLKEKNKSSN